MSLKPKSLELLGCKALLRPHEVAELLSLSMVTIYRYMRQGKVEVVTKRGHRFIREGSIRSLLKEQGFHF